MFVGAEAEGRARPAPARCMQRLRRATASVVGMQVYFREIQNINLGGRIAKGEYQYTLQSSDTETLYRVAPRDADKISDGPGPARRQHRPLHQEPADEIEIDREKAAVYGITSTRSARSSTTRSASARSRRSTRRSTTTRSSWRSGRSSRLDASGLSKIYLKTNLANTSGATPMGGGVMGTGTPNGMSIPLSAVTRLVPEGRSAAGQPSGPAALGDDLVQPRCRAPRSATAVDAIQQIERELEPAAVGLHRLPGQRAGVPGVAERAGHPDARGDLRRLSWCSASCTRASSIRSPSSPACRRPASARCSC